MSVERALAEVALEAEGFTGADLRGCLSTARLAAATRALEAKGLVTEGPGVEAVSTATSGGGDSGGGDSGGDSGGGANQGLAGDSLGLVWGRDVRAAFRETRASTSTEERTRYQKLYRGYGGQPKAEGPAPKADDKHGRGADWEGEGRPANFAVAPTDHSADGTKGPIERQRTALK